MNGEKPTTQERRGLAGRFIEYQAERFPFIQHGPLILAFTFSAVAYSRVCRGATGFIPAGEFAVGAITSLLLFFLLRVADEFKDAEEDARYRPYRPVPRGLISLRELGWIGAGVVIVQLLLNSLVMPLMLAAYAIPVVYLALMTREFFVRDWLKRHPMIYMFSHMLILPAIDFYTTGLDWLNAGVPPPRGIEFFLLVTYLNGIVIEVGRKIRGGEAEEEGVETYSALYGPRRAAFGWLGVLLLTYTSALLAAGFAGYGTIGFIALTIILAVCSLPALLFLRSGSHAHARRIELSAGIWTILMYLTLGGVPMLVELGA